MSSFKLNEDTRFGDGQTVALGGRRQQRKSPGDIKAREALPKALNAGLAELQ